MRYDPKLERYRFITDAVPRNEPGLPSGTFIIPGPEGTPLTLVIDDGTESGWEHVSVHGHLKLSKRQFKPRIPSWTEMCFAKDLFWEAEDCVVQFHPPQSDYINCAQYVLHLWRWRDGEFPRPPSHLVGPRVAKEETEREVKQSAPDLPLPLV